MHLYRKITIICFIIPLFVFGAYFILRQFDSDIIRQLENKPKVIVQIDSNTYHLKLSDDRMLDYLKGSLPADFEVKRWEGMLYAPNPLDLKNQDYPEYIGKTTEGHLAIWEPSDTICIFFGRSGPVIGPTPRLGEVGLLLGQLEGDLNALSKIEGTAYVTIRLDEY